MNRLIRVVILSLIITIFTNTKLFLIIFSLFFCMLALRITHSNLFEKPDLQKDISLINKSEDQINGLNITMEEEDIPLEINPDKFYLFVVISLLFFQTLYFLFCVLYITDKRIKFILIIYVALWAFEYLKSILGAINGVKEFSFRNIMIFTSKRLYERNTVSKIYSTFVHSFSIIIYILVLMECFKT